MKHLILFITLTLSILKVNAQYTPLQKYYMPLPEAEEKLFHKASKHKCRVIEISHNHYVGQTDKKGVLSGYGSYLMSNGSQLIGQFEDGRLRFGITINSSAAVVGSKEYYASYSLTTGKLEFWKNQFGHNVASIPENFVDYAFLSLTYANGDRYIGETYKGLRHGYGIYYYADGSYWYGQYHEGERKGYGAMFYTDDTMQIGKWDGEMMETVVNIDK